MARRFTKKHEVQFGWKTFRVLTVTTDRSPAQSMKEALRELSAGHDVFLGRLGDDRVAVVVQPIDQRPDRGVLLILHYGSVVERPEQYPPTFKFAEQPLVIDIELERLGCGKKIGSVAQLVPLLATQSVDQ